MASKGEAEELELQPWLCHYLSLCATLKSKLSCWQLCSILTRCQENAKACSCIFIRHFLSLGWVHGGWKTKMIFIDHRDVIFDWAGLFTQHPCPPSFSHRLPLKRPWKMLQKHANRQKHGLNSLLHSCLCLDFRVQILFQLCSYITT